AAPCDAGGFVAWFERLALVGPGQGDALFPWLAERASMDEMRWLLAQEIAGEAGFDDLLALAQLRLPTRARLEVARNLWDEMGRGHAIGMHGPLLTRLTDRLAVPIGEPVWEAQALANLMVALCANRRFAWQALGALGVIELTAPTRVGLVDQGLQRLGVDSDGRRYFSLHAVIDRAHGRAWIDEVIHPLVAEDPSRARPLAEGALMRLEAGRRCFARYRAHFSIG
nr:iron-containing redox enzyme family protein [Planctomycetota bacterium]